MSADDDLRPLTHLLEECNKIAENAYVAKRDGTCEAVSDEWLDGTRQTAAIIAMSLERAIPVMRSKLAQAYAHGFRANAPHTPDAVIATRNPWAQEVPRG